MSASFSLVYLSKKQYSAYENGEKDYTKRINRYCSFRTMHIPPIKNASKLDRQTLLSKESEQFLQRISSKTCLVILDEQGKSHSSISFSQFVSKLRVAHKDVLFIIGGAYGFGQALYDRANYKIKLSDLTLPHELARLLFLEQLYRTFTIMNGEKYHHE